MTVESLLHLFDNTENAVHVFYLMVLDMADCKLKLIFRQIFTSQHDLFILDCLHSLVQGNHRNVQKFIQLCKHSSQLTSNEVLLHAFDELSKSLVVSVGKKQAMFMLLDFIIVKYFNEPISDISKICFLSNLKQLCLAGIDKEQELKDMLYYLACINEEDFLKRLVEDVVLLNPALIEKCLRQPFLTARQCEVIAHHLPCNLRYLMSLCSQPGTSQATKALGEEISQTPSSIQF